MPFQNKTLTGGTVDLPTLKEIEAEKKRLDELNKKWSDCDIAIKDIKIERGDYLNNSKYSNFKSEYLATIRKGLDFNNDNTQLQFLKKFQQVLEEGVKKLEKFIDTFIDEHKELNPNFDENAKGDD